ncbi:Xylose operon regulatory protein [Gimesia panareensis]|uniref:Xylose operon regulatory protein n=1 Tax=Gimesia panareensis TaxID=2527978 RepID=A0A517Q945_9PLAN|nr:XylR family transcriptional regulator [Gimesia panareensis]QDT28152.1 Xylose operon regulatory protein [Gimesia panareensis]
MASSSIPHVALLIETSRSHGRGLLNGIRQFIAENEEWSVFLMPRSLDSQIPDWISRWKGDGILSRTISQEMADAITASGIPTVELRSTKLKHSFPFLGIDNRAMGRLVAEHFLERGIRHFGVYEIGIEVYFEERRDNYIQTIEEAGFEVSVFSGAEDSEAPREWEKHQEQMANWVRGLPKPVGIMACTDQLGFWLLDACDRAGISVPDEVAVVGVENDEILCMMARPPLSSVAFNSARIGYEAAALLSRLMKGEPTPEEPFMIDPLGIVTRQSSDVVAVDDPDLARALRFIRENACRGIQVVDILKQVPLSRTALERQMKAAIGRSPKAEILRNQLERAKELLASTELSLAQISERVGFRHAQHFSTIFKEKLGETPGAYRAKMH